MKLSKISRINFEAIDIFEGYRDSADIIPTIGAEPASDAESADSAEPAANIEPANNIKLAADNIKPIINADSGEIIIYSVNKIDIKVNK